MEDCVLLFIQYLTFSVTSALNYEIGGNVLCPVPSPMEYFQVKSVEHSGDVDQVGFIVLA